MWLRVLRFRGRSASSNFGGVPSCRERAEIIAARDDNYAVKKRFSEPGGPIERSPVVLLVQPHSVDNLMHRCIIR